MRAGRMQICPIILCGGEGSRLWPVSRRDFPKQFAALIGDLSCFQQAVLRLHNMPGTVQPIVVTGEAHEAIVHDQLKAIGVEGTIILEPEGRDSGPATVAAAAWLAALGYDHCAIMQPADHYIPDAADFRSAAQIAATGAERGFIVTFGVAPVQADTSYGYISRGDVLPDCPGVTTVRRFIEKPSREKAIEYLAQGYVWNSGMFAFRPSVLLEEVRLFEPAMADAVERALGNATRTNDTIRLDPVAFGQSPRKSLDHAVMERTARAAVVAGDFAWSDLGAWSAIYGAQPKDERGNVILGEGAVVLDSERCFVRSAGTPLAAIGLADVAVVAEPDGVVVCNLKASASVKLAVDALRAKARPQALRKAPGPRGGGFENLAVAAQRLGYWLDSSALPLWWAAGADHERGGFFELLDGDARPVRVSRRVRVQARQVYVYATAGLAGWHGPWKSAVAHGLSHLTERYRKPDGLYRTLIDDEGEPLDDRTFLYDQAFVLLALASAANAGIERRRCIADALELRANLFDRFARTDGGFLEQELRGSKFQSNPHMHLLEAAMEWCNVDPDREWEALAASTVRLALERFIDAESGILREFFDDDGLPFPGLPGRLVEPGHQFEWAWLLSRWAASRNDAAVAAAASRLFELGDRHGVDRMRGVAIDMLLADMSPHSRQARLWPQTERLKAALALAAAAPSDEIRDKLGAVALAAAEGMSHYLQTQIPGLWRDKMRADGTFIVEPSPASSLYHLACAIQGLRNHAG